MESGKSVGWDWDIRSGRDRWFGDLETVFGIPSDNYSRHVDDFRRKVHPDDRELVWQAVADARQNQKPFATEFRVIRTDATVRWISWPDFLLGLDGSGNDTGMFSNVYASSDIFGLLNREFGVASGFEEQDAFTRHGLGLISMRERLQLVQGEFSVKSKPGAGTTIRARVR